MGPPSLFFNGYCGS
jgi:hypothetical protein